MLLFGLLIILCCQHQGQAEVLYEVGGVSTNVRVSCVLHARENQVGVFWLINGFVYGLLHLPREFTVCAQVKCDPNTLVIPVIQSEMNASTFECIRIRYENNGIELGEQTELIVSSINVTLHGSVRRDVLELDYTQLSIGAVNTTIAWRYSSLTCQPSVFTIEGYADRETVGDTPTLTLNSTSTEIRVPTSTIQHHITSGALYLRLLAYQESGAGCANDSTMKYYKLDNTTIDSIPVYTSPEGMACVFIPVNLSSGRDYSSLEVVWPEHGGGAAGGRLCYCPPYEGEQSLFSRCTSSTSCNTSHSIEISNHTLCFSQLSQELATFPVRFTLLDFCPNQRCIVRYTLVAFVIVLVPPPAPTISYTNSSVCFWSDSAVVESFLVNITDASGNRTAFSGTYTTPQCLPITSDLCVPLTVSAISANRIGRSNITDLTIEYQNNPNCFNGSGNFSDATTDDSDTTADYTIENSSIEEKTQEDIEITKPNQMTTPFGVLNIVAAAIGALVVILLLLPVAILCYCYKRRKCKSSLTRNKRKFISQPAGIEAIDPPPPSPRDSVIFPVPEYEEIQELRETRRHDDTAGEHALRGDYKFTQCPAYGPAVLPVPEYEEIQELREARRRDDTAEEHALRGDYDFTQCPAYAVTTIL